MMELHENIDEALFTPLFFRYTRRERKRRGRKLISLSEENRKIAKQICYIHHVTDIIDTVKQIDPKQALVKLDKRLSKKEENKLVGMGDKSSSCVIYSFILIFLLFCI